MIRLLHLLAITVLIGSAAYAYSVKYETLYYAETLAKLKGKLQKERETIAIAKAEWALLTRPDRLQRMVDRHLDLQPMTVAQLARLSDLPSRGRGDAIAAKLDALGGDPTTTGSTAPASALPAGAKPKPPAPRLDGIGAKLDSLGLGAAKASKGSDKRTADARPATKPAADKPSTGKPVPKPAASKSAAVAKAEPVKSPPAKPATR